MGIAQAGTTIVDGGNVATLGFKPLGIAALDAVVYRAGPPFAGWQLVSNTAIGTPGSTTPPIDTTGATLICIVTSVFRYVFNPGEVTDSENNIWTQAVWGEGNNFTESQIFYCLNPVTNSAHTFSSSPRSYASIYIGAFKGTITAALDQSNALAGPSGSETVISSATLTPTHNNSLVIAGLTTNSGNATYAIDSGFTISNQGGSESGAAAFLAQTIAATIAPTWTLTSGNINAGSVTTIASFKP